MTPADQLSHRRLRDVVTLEKGKPPAQQPYFLADAEAYLTPDYLRGGRSIEMVKPGANAVRVSDGDTIVLWDGSNAGEVMRGRDGVLASTMARTSHGIDFDRGYFFYALKRWEPFLKGQTSGSGIPHVDKEILGNLGIIQFDRPEQKEIAQILRTIDVAIEQTRTLITKQEWLKTGLMQDLLTRGIDEHGNLRSENTHEFKDSPLGRIPVEWEVESFGTACTRVSVGIASSTAKHFRTHGVPLLRNQNVLAGRFELSDLLHISREFDAINKSKRLRSGDLVTMRTGYPGRTAVVTEEMQGWQTFTTLICSPNTAFYLPAYMCLQMNAFVGRGQILLLQGGGAQQNLNVGWIKNMRVLRPQLDEQRQTVAFLEALDRAMAAHVQQRAKLGLLRNALMQDLLSGTRRVTTLLVGPGMVTA